jgi:long-chain acyl-CoA synthetase
LPNVQIRISEDREIFAKGPNIMQGYLGEEKLDDGWIRTGDLGRLDDQGNLFIEGCSKEAMVTATGETIFPDEIEPYYQHDDFHETCVVPLSGEDGNDHPVLVIYPKEGVGDLQHRIHKMAAHAPARSKVMDFIQIDHPLPRTELGKIRRRLLAEQIEENMNG